MTVELNSVKEAAMYCLKSNLTVVEVKTSDLLTLIDKGEKLLEENIKLREALEEIKEITKSMVEMNPAYEKMHKIALKGLGESK